VYGPSAYASGLGKKYMEEIKGLGVEMADVYPLTLTSNESDRASPLAGSRAARAILAAASNPRRELVFLSMYPEEAFSLVMRLREESPELKILGVDALASAEFPALFKGRGLEAGAPGFYTDGLYVSTPMIFDTANEFTRQFRNDYQTSYGREPDWRAAFAYDAAKVIVDAMRGAEITGSKASLQEDRQKLRAAIAAFDSPVTAVKGVTGANYFDGNGDPMKSVYVAQYRNGQVISAPYQLAQVVRTTPTVNANGTIEHAGKVEMRLRQVVYTGISAEEVTEVDTDSATARIKGKLWFRFSGELDTSRLIFINAETPVNLGQPLREARLPDGSRYVLYGFEGVFRLDALSEDVRFGEPVIGLGFRHADLDRTRLVFVEDVIGHGRGGHVELLEEILESGAFKPSTGWVPVRARMYSQTVGVAREGQPEYLKEDTARVDYSSFNLAVRAKANELTRRFLNSQSASVLLMLGIPLALLVFHFSTSRRDDPRSRHLAWILEIILAVLVLIAGEILLVDMLDDEINSPYPRLATMIFDMLWWLVPAMLIIINLERHLWRPIEIRSERPIPDLLRGTVAIVVLVFAILGIVAYVFNEKVTSLLATSGMLAMIIGLAVQVNLSHLFSGLAINLERPFRVGDWVKIGDHEEAKVVGVSWRATRLETRDREIIHVP
ncbi:MAG: mechanosensitive ion channel domain-containing protein, partial [Gammaproteobacteria bacterium]